MVFPDAFHELTLTLAICVVLASSILILSVHSIQQAMAEKHRVSWEQFADPTYISTLHVTTSKPALTIVIPASLLPCSVAVKALQSVPQPLTPLISRGVMVGDQAHDLTCSDVVSTWMLGSSGTTGTQCVVAACPKSDLRLVIISCMGGGDLPHTPLTSKGMSLHDLAEAGDTILCASQVEQRIIKDICSCAETPISVNTSLLGISSSVGNASVSYMRPVGHPDLVSALHRRNAVVVNLPKLDAGRFAMAQPLAKLSGNGDGSSQVSSTAILVGEASLDGDPRVNAVVHALNDVDPLWALAELNYASRYLSILPSTRELLRPMDTAAMTRTGKDTLRDALYTISAQAILEGEPFNNSATYLPITLVTYDQIHAYMTSTSRSGLCRVLEVRDPYIGASRMRLGDRVVLKSQEVSKHDGEYIVQALALGTRGTVLVTWFEATYDAMTFTDVEVGSLVERGDPSVVIMTASVSALADPQHGNLWPSTSATLKKGDMLLLLNLHNTDGGTGIWTIVTQVTASMVTVKTFTPAHTAASDGSCITSPTTEIKSVCLAQGGLWDSPCTADDQCPFFQRNKRYPNYRGGCLTSGWCEMPLGVTQPSFKTSVGDPACHGQMDGHDSHDRCMDIAFPLDEYERSVFTIDKRQVIGMNP